jgi:signal peptide peptidase SppA
MNFLVPQIVGHHLDEASPWAIAEPYGRKLFETIDRLDIRAAAAGRAPSTDKTNLSQTPGVSVVPIVGTLTKWPSWWSFFIANTSTVATRQTIAKALRDREVLEILLYIDSPGGQTAGIGDLWRTIFEARKIKPVTAFIEDLGASAAYYIASGASRAVINLTGWTGSIGVYTAIDDVSAAYAKAGIRTHVIRSAEAKGRGVPGEPVSEDALRNWQIQVDLVHTQFMRAIAEGRGLELGHVDALADGRLIGAVAAKNKGLVDEIGTFEGTVAELVRRAAPKLKTIQASAEIEHAIVWELGRSADESFIKAVKSSGWNPPVKNQKARPSLIDMPEDVDEDFVERCERLGMSEDQARAAWSAHKKDRSVEV